MQVGTASRALHFVGADTSVVDVRCTAGQGDAAGAVTLSTRSA